MNIEEQTLWSYLDKCGIEFRSTKKVLVTRYGSYARDGYTNYEIGFQSNFIQGLKQQLCFRLRNDFNFSEFPNELSGTVRISADPLENYNHAVTQLVRLFGDGWDSSIINYTKSREWNFGLAKVSATIYLPDLNKEIVRSGDECRIEIDTAFCPISTKDELAALSTFKSITASNLPYTELDNNRISKQKKAKLSFTRTGLTQLSRRVDQQLACDLGVDAAFNYLIFIDECKIVHFVPTTSIKNILYEQSIPLKGRGGIRIWVRYEQTNPEIASNILVLATSYNENAFKSLAQELSAILSVPLKELVYEDH